VVPRVASIHWKTDIDLNMNCPSRRSSVLLLCLCSLLHSCTGLVVPCTFGWTTPRLKSVTRGQRSWLSATKTKTSPSAAFGFVSFESLMLADIPGKSMTTTMTSENGIVGLNDDKEINEEAIHENDAEDSQEESKNEDDEQSKHRTAAAAATLLARKRGASRTEKPLKSTSVGARKVGSATRDRRSQGRTSKIMDTVRTVAAAASSCASENTNTTAKATEPQRDSRSKTQVGDNVIQATISSILESQNTFKKPLDNNEMSMNVAYGPMGILGDRPDPLSHELLSNPMPGTVLLFPTLQTSRRASSGTLSVRVATTEDDFQIANLRLSVFSDFSSDLRQQFCARSCQVLADRRLRGATCLVATRPSNATRSDVILGSVECSVHEFYATKLGRRRKKHSTFYITEVAVHPSTRRCGIGSKLLQVHCRDLPPVSWQMPSFSTPHKSSSFLLFLLLLGS
jgi:GNAT superfamily N-acetyltransferase